MVTVRDVLSFSETLAPAYMKMEWDNVGLLCGTSDKEVRRILIALDPFENVCEEAAQWEADLLVAHHPLIFQPLHQVTTEDTIGRSLNILIKNDINGTIKIVWS